MPNTISVSGWLGSQKVTLVVEDTADAATIHALLRKAVLTQEMGLTPSQAEAVESEKITAVILRWVQNRRDNTQTPVVDCYPDWNATGTYGQYRWGYIYLNTPEDVAEFERVAGVQLSKMQSAGVGVSPIQRHFGQRHPAEVAVRPFHLSRKQVETDEQGRPRYKYSLHAQESGAEAPWHLTAKLDEVQSWAVEKGYAANLLEVEQLIAPLNWWNFPTARAAAEAIVAAHKEHVATTIQPRAAQEAAAVQPQAAAQPRAAQQPPVAQPRAVQQSPAGQPAERDGWTPPPPAPQSPDLPPPLPDEVDDLPW